MILLLTVPYLGQAGVKRLQISRRRTRWEKQLPESRSVLNRRDISRYVDITRYVDRAAPYSLKSSHFHIPGLTSKPMFTRTSVSSHSHAAGQSCRRLLPVAQSNSARLTVSFNSGSGTSRSDNSGSVPKTLRKNVVAHVFAPIVF
jgi:hypothetical protein